MAILLASCVTAFLLCFIIIPVVIKYSLKKNLGDSPGRRKVHKTVKPSMGGIAIFMGFLIAALIWMDFSLWYQVHYLLASMFIVFLLGVRDDLVPFRALHKLYGQIIAVVIFSFSSIQIGSFYGLFGIETIWTPLAYIITGFTIIVITNSFNLIDGLDGLAGSISLIALIAFGVWFFMADDYVFALLSFCMTGGLLAFMVFNWEPSEIFMGDTGAMVIGMLLAVLAIRFLNINDTLPVDSALKYKAPIAGAISFLIIPIADTIRIIILRVSRGQSPFTPDKSHIHHAIMRLGMTHSQTAIILATVNVLFLAVVFAFRDYPDGYVILCVAVFGAAMSFVLDRLITRKVQAKAS